MRIAVISDIHGNRPAFEAVEADIARLGVDATINLGDLVSGPVDPAGTLDLLIERNLPTIIGNHDRYLMERPAAKLDKVDRFVAGQLTAAHFAYLRGLPETSEVARRGLHVPRLTQLRCRAMARQLVDRPQHHHARRGTRCWPRPKASISRPALRPHPHRPHRPAPRRSADRQSAAPSASSSSTARPTPATRCSSAATAGGPPPSGRWPMIGTRRRSWRSTTAFRPGPKPSPPAGSAPTGCSERRRLQPHVEPEDRNCGKHRALGDPPPR